MTKQHQEKQAKFDDYKTFVFMFIDMMAKNKECLELYKKHKLLNPKEPSNLKVMFERGDIASDVVMLSLIDIDQLKTRQELETMYNQVCALLDYGKAQIKEMKGFN